MMMGQPLACMERWLASKDLLGALFVSDNVTSRV